MKVKHEPNYISDKVEWLQSFVGVTPGEYNVI